MGNAVCYSDQQEREVREGWDGSTCSAGLKTPSGLPFEGNEQESKTRYRSDHYRTRDGGRIHSHEKYHHQDIIARHYRKIRLLEKTHYGQVWEARDIHTGRRVAVKESSRYQADRRENIRNGVNVPEDVRNEAYVHQHLYHPGIVEFIEFQETENQLYIVLDYCDVGSLFDEVQKTAFHGESLTRWHRMVNRWFIQIARAIEYAHNERVCHNDLSLQNILLKRAVDGNIDAVIADFGLCERFDVLTGEGRCMSKKKVGKANFASPECFHPKTTWFDGKANDVWCLGIILFMCLTKCNVYETPLGSNCRELMKGRRGIKKLLRRWKKDSFPEDAIDLLARIFVPESNRINIQEVLRSPYCQR